MTIALTNQYVGIPPPETVVDATVAFYTALQVGEDCSALSCVSLTPTVFVTATIDGTPYPVLDSTLDPFTSEDPSNQYNFVYTFSEDIVITQPTQTAELVCIFLSLARLN
jgi:hypothetical protein